MAINPADEPVAAPVLYGLASLVALMGWGACSGLHWAWRRSFGRVAEWFANALDSVGVKIPYVGTIRPFSAPVALIRAADYAVSHGLAATALTYEYAFVYTSSHAAAQIREVARWIEEAGLHTLAFVHKLDHVVFPRLERRILTLAEHAAQAIARPIEREAVHLYRLASHYALVVEQAAIRAEHAAAHALDWSEVEFGRAWRGIDHLGHRLKFLERLANPAAFAALVAVALSRLGLRWLRCSNVKKVGRRLCGMDIGLLESLLTDSLEVAALTDLCEIVALSERAAEEFEPLFKTIIALQDNLCLFGGALKPSAVEVLYPERTDWLPSAV